MNEVDELFTAMLAVVVAAMMLVAGGWYIDNTPKPRPAFSATQTASVP